MSLFRKESPSLGTTGVQASNSGDVALTVQGADGQTAKVLSIQDTSGTEKASFSVAGVLALPADGLTQNGVKVVPQEPLVVLIPAAAQAVASNIFIADRAYQVTGISEAHTVASSSGTLDVLKCTGTAAPSAGTSLLTAPVSTAGAANTVLAGVLTGTVGTLQLAVGDRLGINPGGTQTNLAGCALQVMLKAI